ncbi:MAG: RHS repeat-associated core domain-containing protein [Bradymonadaceae bacterium]
MPRARHHRKREGPRRTFPRVETGVLSLVDEGCYGERGASASSDDGLEMGFHGVLWDEESGLYYTNARYYDPATGEFLTPDPEGIEAGPASYTYAGGNPIIFGDPSGRFLLWAFAGSLLAGAAIVGGLYSLQTSQEAKRTRNSYRSITDIDESLESDSAVDVGEKAHQRLTETSIKGGETAIEGVRSFIGAATDPASSAESVLDAVIDQVLDD